MLTNAGLHSSLNSLQHWHPSCLSPSNLQSAGLEFTPDQNRNCLHYIRGSFAAARNNVTPCFMSLFSLMKIVV